MRPTTWPPAPWVPSQAASAVGPPGGPPRGRGGGGGGGGAGAGGSPAPPRGETKAREHRGTTVYEGAVQDLIDELGRPPASDPRARSASLSTCCPRSPPTWGGWS